MIKKLLALSMIVMSSALFSADHTPPATPPATPVLDAPPAHAIDMEQVIALLIPAAAVAPHGVAWPVRISIRSMNRCQRRQHPFSRRSR